MKRHMPNFDINNLEDICAREGIDVEMPMAQPASASAAFQFAPPGENLSISSDPVPSSLIASTGSSPPKGYPPSFPPPPQHMLPPGYPHPMPGYYGGPPPGSPYAHHPHMAMHPPPGFNPHMVPTFVPPPPPPQLPHMPHAPPAQPPRPSSSGGGDIKGQDPQFNDMSNTQVQPCPAYIFCV